ncbi:MAG: radical SAM protein [Clostridia bacterium]|jgi:DNA repair photolyase
MHFKEVKEILLPNNGMNIFRGCTHGCIYCDSRSRCYHIEHGFEDIEVKSNAPQLLEAALLRKREKCMISTGSMCDPYLHEEMQLGYTRKCLEIIERYGFGLSILTKSNRILRDLDLLKGINARSKCLVQMTLTTYDEDLCKILEPNVSTTKERFETLKIMRDNGIPTIVWFDPLLPYINDTEENMRGILDLCIKAKVYGILCFGIGLTLREGNREYFYSKLDEFFPGLKEKYIRRYGYSYQVTSDNSDKLMKIFHELCRANNIVSNNSELFAYMHKYNTGLYAKQLSFF